MSNTDVETYISDFLDIVQENSVRNRVFNGKPAIDWKSYREDVLGYFKRTSPSTLDDAREVIRYGLGKLEDNHSSAPPHLQINDERILPPSPGPDGRMIAHNAYLLIPPCLLRDYAEGIAYANTLHRKIADLDQLNPHGWIVDLRTNTGGSCWPMLTGAGPLLGNGTHGHFISENRAKNVEWGYKNGAAIYNDAPCFPVDAPHILQKNSPPIAVLTGDGTNSSGEVLLVAFRGLPHVKTFGAESGGLSTANFPFEIGKTGRYIELTTAVLADRNGREYGSKIKPDFARASNFTYDDIVKKTYNPGDDRLVRSAVKWINNQAEYLPVATPTI